MANKFGGEGIGKHGDKVKELEKGGLDESRREKRERDSGLDGDPTTNAPDPKRKR